MPRPAWLIRSTRTRTVIVYSIAVQADGKILAGGDFNGANSIGGQTRNRIARLDATTGLADSFDPNANDFVYSIAVQADGKILAGGFFNGANSIGGQTRNCIARLDATTGLADSFDPNANSVVHSIAVQADGKILAGGYSTERTASADRRATASPGSMPRPAWLIRSTRTRTIIVYSIAVQADGKILAGGSFTSIGGQPRSLFARLSNDTAALQNLAVTQTTITWTRGGSSPQFTRVTFEYSTDNVNYTPLGNGTAAGSNWTLTGLSLSDRTELLHPRSRLLSQRLPKRLGEHHGIRAECFYCWAANPNTYADTASFGQHIRHCHLLHESDPSPSAKCDDDPDWYYVGLNLDQRLRCLHVFVSALWRELYRDADQDRPDARLHGHQHRGCGRHPTACPHSGNSSHRMQAGGS